MSNNDKYNNRKSGLTNFVTGDAYLTLHYNPTYRVIEIWVGNSYIGSLTIIS